jgi:hypothetical protein
VRIPLPLALFLAATHLLPAENIPVPNSSFESPATPFVDLAIDSWQKTPKPDWYVESGGFSWTQLAGAFKNTPAGNFDHIDNCDGEQAIWVFAVPGAGVFQDYASLDWNDANPTHAFNARFEVGKAYRLTIGVIGMGGGMSNGVTAEVSLYFRDAASNQIAVATAAITNSPLIFSNRTHFVDFTAAAPIVRAGDAWAGQQIGVQILSTVTTNLQGGYWAFDNVRLESLAEHTVTLTATIEPEGIRVGWLSAAGHAYQAQSSANLVDWSDAGAPIPGTGGLLSRHFPVAGQSNVFVRVVAFPSP